MFMALGCPHHLFYPANVACWKTGGHEQKVSKGGILKQAGLDKISNSI